MYRGRLGSPGDDNGDGYGQFGQTGQSGPLQSGKFDQPSQFGQPEQSGQLGQFGLPGLSAQPGQIGDDFEREGTLTQGGRGFYPGQDSGDIGSPTGTGAQFGQLQRLGGQMSSQLAGQGIQVDEESDDNANDSIVTSSQAKLGSMGKGIKRINFMIDFDKNLERKGKIIKKGPDEREKGGGVKYSYDKETNKLKREPKGIQRRKNKNT